MATKEKRFLCRDLSWVEFNARVLDEGLNQANPLLERLKFLSIVSSNFDEFFMVRVAGLKRQAAMGNKLTCPSGLRPSEQLRRISDRVHEIVALQYQHLTRKLLPALAAAGIRLVRYGCYNREQLSFTADMFEREILPTLTPLAVEPEGELPFTGNLRMHAAFILKAIDPERDPSTRIAIVQIPQSLKRLVPLPCAKGDYEFTLIGDIVVQHAARLFPGYAPTGHCLFRVTRDSDMSVDEERDEDFLEAMQEVLRERERSAPVRLEVSATSNRLTAWLRKKLGLKKADTFEFTGPLDLKSFMPLVFEPGFDQLRDEEWPPQQSPDLPPDTPIWDVLKARDVLLHHPYESFDAVIRLLDEAADDPNVVAIKITLYRTSGQSPVVKALARAAANGKQVTALVELKARFDEEKNIAWAQQLERVGVIVVYGLAHLKVHSKAVLIVRREPTGVVRYIHLGTGNYNDRTARLYTDMGLLTSREDLSYDLVLFFNTITGYSVAPKFRKLIMAPLQLRERVLGLIRREVDSSSHHDPGLIMAKLNSLVDPQIINALYDASKAGIRILLNVRGICCLRPGVKGLSENIRVVSIIDRFLEHSRIFWFHNGGNEEVYLSSADWMPRNLDRRVELMFPVEDPALKKRLLNSLEVFFSDNTNAHDLRPDGTYVRRRPEEGQGRVRAQAVFYRTARTRARSALSQSVKGFVVRRKPPEAKP